jgi:phosphatidyl-myo-inositol dimannoside synthase
MILFSFDYPPCDGGISRLCAGIVGQLRLSGADLTVLTQRPPRYPQVDSYDIQRVSGNRPLREILALFRLKRLKKLDSTVLCGIWYPEGVIAVLSGCKNIVILGHGNELMAYNRGWRKIIWDALRRWVLKRASCIIANSSYTAGLAAHAAPGAVVQTLLPAVDHVRFKPGDRDAARDRLGLDKSAFIIGTVSRLVRYKGFETVFRAIDLIPPAQRRNVRYIIAGRGGDEVFLRRRAEELGIGTCVQWRGFLAEETLPLFYQALDIFALCTMEDRSSRSVEGFGLSLLEAQACGIPAVGARCGGIPEAVDEQCGFLIEQSDHAALAGIFQTLLENKAIGRTVGIAARKRVENECAWKNYAEKLTAIIGKETIAPARHPRQRSQTK